MSMKEKKNDLRGEFKFQNAYYTIRHVLRRKVSSLIFFFSLRKKKIKLKSSSPPTDLPHHKRRPRRRFGPHDPDSPYGPDNNN